MTREEEIRQASIEYTMENAPKCIGGDAFSEVMNGMNRNHAFEEGAKWADKNPRPQTIAEYLYKEKGYPISLNGEIPTFEETMKDVQTYNDYKAKQWLEKACKWLEQHQEDYDDYDAWKGDYVNFTSLIIDFRKAMEK